MINKTVNLNTMGRRKDVDDKRFLEAALPTYMMLLAMESMLRKGESVMMDFGEALARSLKLVFDGLDEFSRERLTKALIERGHSVLMSEWREDDPLRLLLYAAAKVSLKLAAEGHIPTNEQAALIGLEICRQAEDGTEDWGGDLELIRGRDIASGCYNRIFMMGMYTTAPLDGLPRSVS